MSFSTRVLKHPKIVPASPPQPNQPLELAMHDQLLVCKSVQTTVLNGLKNFMVAEGDPETPIAYKLLTSLLDQLPFPTNSKLKSTIDDVLIYELTLPLPGGITVFELVQRFTTAGDVNFLALADSRKLTPNHVLIPGPVEGHGCPYGPPSPLTGAPPQFHPAPGGPAVTIVDSGFQWNRAWGENPLGARFTPSAEGAQAPGTQTSERLPTEQNDALGHWSSGHADVPVWPAGPTGPTSPEVVPGTSKLVALAGHANFIAGVIMQGCPDAQITIRNHNGAFDPASDDPPTEATVARSLCRCVQDGAQVIDVGFAFVTGDVSCIWDAAFQYLAGLSKPGSAPMVIAPAGNQDSTVPRFPAALATIVPAAPTDPHLFQNVVGVASMDSAADWPPNRSCFSNHGPWATCAAVGHNVVSTFLNVNMQLEDGGPPPADEGIPECSGSKWSFPATKQDFTKHGGWATWNGTSFATPKIVGAIAAQLAAQPLLHPVDAWKALLGAGPGVVRSDPNDVLGNVFLL
jgi:hypothetical protein